MTVGVVVQEPPHPSDHAYFPNGGLGSVVAVMDDGSMTEAAVIGIDGFVGAPLALGAKRATTRILWQVAGEAYRIPAEQFVNLLNGGCFGGTLNTYIQELSDQMAQTAGCNRRHTISQRAARWLLMTGDRVDGGQHFTLTQEFLALMLGVGRPKVTLAAQKLQQDGLISYRRGNVTIRDRAGLESTACECYTLLAATYPGH
jgi:CRP-like cAMP-binding protein